MQNEEVFALSLDIGCEIIKSGGEISRAQDTIIRINNAYNNPCEVFALPSIIIAQSGKNIQIRYISREVTDLAELSRLNTLSRRLCNKNGSEIRVTKKTIYTKAQNLTAVFIATAAFCIFFGGNITEAIFSGTIGILISIIPFDKFNIPMFTINLISAFISAVFAYIPIIVGINSRPDKIIIGTIMLLVPGLTVVSAIRDMMQGDMISGLFELFNAIMSALAIAFGVAGAIWVMNWI